MAYSTNPPDGKRILEDNPDHTGALMHSYDLESWWCSDRACPVCHGSSKEPPPDTSWVKFEDVSDGNGPMFAVLMFALMLVMVAAIVVLEVRRG